MSPLGVVDSGLQNVEEKADTFMDIHAGDATLEVKGKQVDKRGIDEILTDSGYESRPAGEPERERDVAMMDEHSQDDSDAMTTISAATTIIPTVAQDSIAQVCNDIYNKIQQDVHKDNVVSVLNSLPGILKTFALRLAHMDPCSVNRRIMHFVYSRHQ